ncbi:MULTISPECIES: symmetrical bis(5'-nucleosyl)-tetraphosphatase [Cellvibrio]|uniref:Bis(5'-nucleosyl)-tetraphosphatase, symmetrical n=1 Tax=Cellvibrio fibrivorans TaxID=126350 RepID=A0ABU1US55_9GAMM|nr:symmetrical bis(5'-nucleosyl)-tetraphosphatase [Cellvibrio fibrivorans]MDR7088023.1 bis(5'-nucleosyl)-tetraphosphatase (symmetrical) [Cellvibrio fibrivorans]
MATYAIGDIQGCLEPLQCLLQEIKFNPSKDKLWLAGDLINRGPDTLETLRFLYRLRDSITIVLGNHDLHFIAVYYGQRKRGKNDTLDELLRAPDCADLVYWLRQQKLVHHDPLLNFTMVHAGIPPQWDLSEALAHAREVENVLQTDKVEIFLAGMYGNLPNRWNDNLAGVDRLRLITNYFTRMRFCSADGELELQTKESVDAAPIGFAPWFSFAERKTWDQRILFGHWAALEGRTDVENVYALDTGCVWGGSLTALRLEDERWFACDCLA